CAALRLRPDPTGFATVRSSQLRRPATLLPYRGCGSAWVPGSVLGCPFREIDPSLPSRPWPHRASVVSFVLRDSDHSKAKNLELVEASLDRYFLPPPGRSERKASQQRVRQGAGGKCAD